MLGVLGQEREVRVLADAGQTALVLAVLGLEREGRVPAEAVREQEQACAPKALAHELQGSLELLLELMEVCPTLVV